MPLPVVSLLLVVAVFVGLVGVALSFAAERTVAAEERIVAAVAGSQHCIAVAVAALDRILLGRTCCYRSIYRCSAVVIW